MWVRWRAETRVPYRTAPCPVSASRAIPSGLPSMWGAWWGRTAAQSGTVPPSPPPCLPTAPATPAPMWAVWRAGTTPPGRSPCPTRWERSRPWWTKTPVPASAASWATMPASSGTPTRRRTWSPLGSRWRLMAFAACAAAARRRPITSTRETSPTGRSPMPPITTGMTTGPRGSSTPPWRPIPSPDQIRG